MPGQKTGKRNRTIRHGFIEAMLDPEVRMLMSLTALAILLGAVVYSLVEGWSMVDSIYFTTVTLATVGYGDLTPQTTFGKLFTVVYIIVGIGLFIALASAVANHLIRRAKLDHGLMEREERKQEAPPPD